MANKKATMKGQVIAAVMMISGSFSMACNQLIAGTIMGAVGMLILFLDDRL